MHGQFPWYSLRILLPSLLWAALLAVCPVDAVVLILPVALIWFAFCFRINSADTLKHVGLILLLLVAAAFAPAKAMDQVLDQTITLPAQKLTLAELVQVTESWRSQSEHKGEFRGMVSWSLETADEETTIHFSTTQPTVREFLAAIEGQSPLRHHFSHCGNAYTILWGNHASTMMSFHRPFP